MEQSERQDPRPSNDSRTRAPAESRRVEPVVERKPSFGERWANLQPSKTMLVWAIIASIALTMLIGFTWGGWVSAGGSTQAGAVVARDAVVQRLAPICVAQFEQDPARDAKLVELMALSASQRTQYVQDQGWATMPGEERPDRQVASACANLLTALTP
jgi:hypothetical protein